MDLSETIEPRSDQMNAEDLLTGPRTFTITEVRKGSSAEQPVSIYLAEFPDDRPFKPSKTVRRILVAAWGKETSVYAGRRMTLYRDPAVKFGGQDVGGIRVSHLSHIERRLSIALTVTRGRRAPYVVEPLSDDAPPQQQPPQEGAVESPAAGSDSPMSKDQQTKLFAQFAELNITDPDLGLAYMTDVLGREVESSKSLSAAEADAVIESQIADLERNADQPPEGGKRAYSTSTFRKPS